MSQNCLIQLKKINNKLVGKNSREQIRYDEFKNSIPEGAIVEVLFSVKTDKGTLAQLAMVHAGIRDLALHLGLGFEAVKLVVKENAGLILHAENPADSIIRSFADCSTEELNLAIKALEDLGAKVNYPA